MNLRRLLPLLCAALLLPAAARAATLNVPAQYPTIQAGVNAAVNGDTVLVADGTYSGPGNRDIDFLAAKTSPLPLNTARPAPSLTAAAQRLPTAPATTGGFISTAARRRR